ncbi:MAG TPA: hypothetical protein VHS28_01470 [Chloroflexota bacterium]|nr:hypothetical protein [Chloroflexota bacterium]
MTYLVLSARAYDFKDESSGRQVQGITLTYADPEPENAGDRRGLNVMTMPASVDIGPQLTQLPGFYDLDFRQRPGPKGRPTLQLVGVQFKAPLSLDGGAR